jgi:hypothetical protein
VPGSITFEWLLAETPGDWQDDMKVTYRRRLDDVSATV